MQNDAAETEVVWNAFSKPLRAFVSRRIRNAEDADDILQEVFMRIHRGLGSVRHNGKLAAWLFQIARNTIVDHYRARRGLEQPLAEDFDAAATSHDEEQNALAELSACVAPMIADLPEKYRAALTMTDLNGLTQSEAAIRLGISVSAMKSRVQRGRRQVKTMLQACCRIELGQLGGVVEFTTRNGRRPCCDYRNEGSAS